MAINQMMIRLALDNLKEKERSYRKPPSYKEKMPSKLNNRAPNETNRTAYENRLASWQGVNREQTEILREKLENSREWQELVRARKERQKARRALRRARNTNYKKKYDLDPVGIDVDLGGVIVGGGKANYPRHFNPYAGIKTIRTLAGPVSVNRTVAPRFRGLINALERSGYNINSLGGYANRNIAGTNTRSLHSYGLAIDINPGANPVTYGHKVTNLPPGISALAAKYGLVWGGDWNGPKYDTMHFSVPWGGRK